MATFGPLPGSSPYPWPYDGHLDVRRVAVVVAGWDTGWFRRCRDPEPVVQVVAEVARAVAGAGGPVVTLTHGGAPRRSPEPSEALGPIADAVDVAASGVDGFYGSALDDVLRGSGCRHLLIVGLGFEGPVHSTLRSANDRGFECLTLPDACAPLDPELAAAAVSTIEMSGGIFGAVAPSSDVLDALTATDGPRSTEVPA